MRVLFWASFLLVVYTYVGYLALLAVLAKVRRPLGASPVPDAKPTVSVVMAVRNESSRLKEKLKNFRRMEYPSHLLEFVVVSDGSTDDSAALLQAESAWLKPVLLADPVGKAEALNQAVKYATGDLLVLCDVRQQIDLQAIALLVRHFGDPRTGAVSGELLLEDAEGKPSGDGLGLYWRIEKAMRRLESATGSVVGVTGALYAVRRSLFPPIPPNTLLDDVYVPMQVARAGYRILFDPEARTRDTVFAEPGKEFRRKVRTLTGNYQLVQTMPWLLTTRNPLLGRFVSHKMLRLIVPLLLIAMLLASAAVVTPFYRLLFALQLVFYGSAFLGQLSPATRSWKPVGIAYTFVLLNVAALVASRNFATGRTGSWD